MRWIALLLLVFGLGLTALAIDVDPSKKTVPRKFFDPTGGKGLNLFGGDPKRIDRANAIRREDFEVTMAFQPEQLAVPASSKEVLPQIRAGLVVRNITKRPKTLAFNNSQRVDVQVMSADGKEIYRWGADKMFVEAIGTSIVMPGEKVAFMVDIPLAAWQKRPRPKESVAFTATLANYPDFAASTNVVFAEGSGSPEPVVPAIASDLKPQSPGGQAFPSLAPASPMAPSLAVPQMPGLSQDPGLPSGPSMPGFSLNPDSGPGLGQSPGIPADPLPKQ